MCSCRVLPMFAGIYSLGAGLGPASAFLDSGPAINVLAIVLTARVLGFDIGLWRTVGAVLFALVVGLGMAGIFRRSEQQKVDAAAIMPVLVKVMGSKSTVTFWAIIVVVATTVGMLYGATRGVNSNLVVSTGGMP